MKKEIEKTKKFFYKTVHNFGSDPYGLLTHVPEMEKWVKFLAEKYTKADKNILMLSVWLHDIGHYPVTRGDHAIKSRRIAKRFLNDLKISEELINGVLHCVRSHRVKDVKPKSLEARIIAAADSASHITDSMYFKMAKQDLKEKTNFRAYAKIKRDARDIKAFPELHKKLDKLVKKWTELLKIYEKTEY